MTIHQVLTFPNALLKRVCEPCGPPDRRARELALDLIETMRANEGCVGLSAPQVGELRRVIVVDVGSHPKAETAHGLLVYVDPVVIATKGWEVAREGCLSLPLITANVGRPRQATIDGWDLEGTRRPITTDGFEARALLHEVDHLDGVLILDRVASPAEVFPRKVG